MNLNKYSLIMMFFIILLARPARGESFISNSFQGFSGYIYSRNYLRLHAVGINRRDVNSQEKSLEDVAESRQRLRINTDWSFTPNLSGKLSVDNEFFYDLDDIYVDEEINSRIWESYLDYQAESWSVKIGKQVIRWGKADQVNIIDNFTPQDLREFLNYLREDRKWPVLASRIELYINNEFTWETIWQPYFTPNPIAGYEEDWEFYFGRNYRKTIGLTPVPERRSKHSLSNGIVATRLLYSGLTFDAGLSYAYHFEQNPSYSVHLNSGFPNSLANLDEPGNVQLKYRRQHSYGFDFETAQNGYGVRGEFVVTTNKPYVNYDLSDDDLIAYRTTLQMVIGVDYTFANEAYINVQFTHDYIPDYDWYLEPDQHESSITWRISKPFFHQKLEIETIGRAFLHELDSFFKCIATYEVKEDFKIETGAMFFEGDDLGIFGEFDSNDQVFVNLKYNF